MAESERQLTGDKLLTMIFPTEEEYVRFVDHVFDSFQGRGLEFTNIPVRTSACVRPWLLERTSDQFSMHEATAEEVQMARNSLRVSGRIAFDPADIVNLHVPGF